MYINSMILTPNIQIDTTHIRNFEQMSWEFNAESTDSDVYYGYGDLKGFAIEMKMTHTLQGNTVLVRITDQTDGDEVLFARLVSAPLPQGSLPWSRKVYVMDRIRVHKNYIGNGIAPGLYRWLASRGYTIISDSHQTQTSLAVWRKLAAKGSVYTINLNDGNWRAYDPLKVEDWMLFGNGDPGKYWPIRFILPGN